MNGSSTLSSDAQAANRGSEHRATNFMEQLQFSYISAIAAAAGCVVWEPRFDDGVDVMLSHVSPRHTSLSDRTARLEIQLKATRNLRSISNRGVRANLSANRYSYYSTEAPTMDKIVVIMDQPAAQMRWISAEKSSLSIYRASYWINIAGHAAQTSAKVSVLAPRSNLFDDIQLCAMMSRVGQGLTP